MLTFFFEKSIMKSDFTCGKDEKRGAEMTEKMIWFLTKDELKKMQHFAIREDFMTLRFCGILIIAFQMIMFLFKTISGTSSTNPMIYSGLCGYLLFVTIISISLLSKLRKNEKNIVLFYLVVKLYVFLVEIWAVGTTCLGYWYGKDLSTFAYTVLACVAVIPIQPIAAITITVFCTVLLNVGLIVMPGIGFCMNTMLQTVYICLIAMLVSVSCFSMRVRRNRLIFAREEHLKEIESLNVKLKGEAERDGLTGLYNRRFLTKHINRKLELGEAPSAVLMVDVDYFKRINDKYGHQNGDECLITISEEIKKCIKHRTGYAVRYGGEEFLVFFESIKKEELRDLAEKIRERVEKLKIELNAHTHISCTVSVGYSYATEGLLYSEMIEKADINLYKAKESGRNRVFGV